MKILPYVTIMSWTWWKYCWKSGLYCGLFRNMKSVIPGRWGFYVLGLEFGSRNPGDRVGVWLINRGIWRW